MNYRVTAVLLVILAALGAYVYFSGSGSTNSTKADDEDLQVLNLDENSVVSVEVKRGGDVMQVKKNAEGKWQIAGPQPSEGDDARMESFAYTIAKLTAARVVTTSPEDLSAYGLSKPEMQVVLGVKDGSPVELLVGNQNPASTGSYVKRSGSDSVYLVGTYSVNQFGGLIDNPPIAKPTPTPSPVLEPTATPPSGS